MSTLSSEQSVTNNEPQTSNQPGNGDVAGSPDEQAVVRSYMDLTGSSEAQARGVFMFISSELDAITQRPN